MNLALFHFIRPYWLLALIPLAVMTVLIVKHKLQRGNWLNVCDEALLPYILQDNPRQDARFPRIGLNVMAAALMIIALAGPTWERVPSPAFRNDAGLVIALDLSKSMEAPDIKPSRLIRARYKIDDILKQRKDGQTALLVYAGDAFTVTPLTNDNATIASQLEALTPDIMPSPGSNTVAAVVKAVDLLKQAGLQKGQILLMTDGVNTDEEAAIVERLGKYQLSVLAVGTEQGAPISLPQGGFLKDDSGAIVMPKLPVSELQRLADAGHGIYQTITDDDSDVKTLLATVDNSVQKSGVDGDKTANDLLLEKWDEKGVWLLLLIVPLAALNFRRGLLAIAFLAFFPLPKNSYALTWQDLWQTKDQQAYSAFKQGDYDKAAKLFQNPAWQAAAQYKSNDLEIKQNKQPTTATGFYNQGNVLAKAGQYPEAIKAYEQALKLNPDNKLKEDALYNKKLVEEALKKQQQQKQNQDSQNSQSPENKDKKQDSPEDKNQKNNKEQKDNKDNKNSQDKKQQNSESGEKQKDKDQAENKQQQGQQNQQQQEQQKQQDAQQTQADKQQADKQQEKNAQLQQGQPQDNEKKRADDEWLNRIPDDPAGLLRRKFKYQYQQRQQQGRSSQNW